MSRGRYKTKAHKFQWCVNNGLRIFPIVDSASSYKLVVSKLTKGKWIETVGSVSYSRNPKVHEEKWYKKINEIYEHFYDKAHQNQ